MQDDLHQVCAETLAMVSAGNQPSATKLAQFCDDATQAIQQSVPRTIKAAGERQPVLIFTDGAWEQGRAGIGAVLLDMALDFRAVLAGAVPAPLIEVWRKLVGDHLICQIELYVMVAIRWFYRDELRDRRTLWFVVDNDAARYSLIKGLSPSPTMRTLVREFYFWEIGFPTFSWIERVPSFSNIPDGPSRGDALAALNLLGKDSCQELPHPPELLTKLLA